jgi:hypothetical protein
MGATIVSQNVFTPIAGLPLGVTYIFGALWLPAGAQIIDIYTDIFEEAVGPTVATVTYGNIYNFNDTISPSLDLKVAVGTRYSAVKAGGVGYSIGGPYVSAFCNPQFPANFNYTASPPPNNVSPYGMVTGPGQGVNFPYYTNGINSNYDIDILIDLTVAPATAGIFNTTVIYQVRNNDGSVAPEYGSYYPGAPAYYTGP